MEDGGWLLDSDASLQVNLFLPTVILLLITERTMILFLPTMDILLPTVNLFFPTTVAAASVLPICGELITTAFNVPSLVIAD